MPDPARRSPLIHAVGVLNLIYGLLFFAWGVYALVEGAEAVRVLFGVKQLADPALGGAAKDATAGLSGAFGRGRVNWYSALAEKGKDGRSALELACGRDKEIADVIEAYLKEQLNVRDSRGMLGVEDAADRGDAESVRALLALGATLRSPGPTVKNALMVAAEKGNIAAAKVLLDSFKAAKERNDFLGLTVQVETGRDSWNRPVLTPKTALDLARAKGHQEVVSLIERAKARK